MTSAAVALKLVKTCRSFSLQAPVRAVLSNVRTPIGLPLTVRGVAMALCMARISSISPSYRIGDGTRASDMFNGRHS